jgi:hypothetical protein
MLLRRYVVLPAILLALGVGDASALTCTVKYKAVYLRDTTGGPDNRMGPDNRLCKYFQNKEFMSERDAKTPWIKVSVPTDEYPEQCPEPTQYYDRNKKSFVGYLTGYFWVEGQGCLQALSCNDGHDRKPSDRACPRQY